MLFKRRNRAHLLEKAQLVGHGPMFHQLAAGNAVKGNPLDGDHLPVRGDTQDLSLKGAPSSEMGHDFVPLCNLVLYGVHRIREGRAE
jgi:hypothetical protein